MLSSGIWKTLVCRWLHSLHRHRARKRLSGEGPSIEDFSLDRFLFERFLLFGGFSLDTFFSLEAPMVRVAAVACLSGRIATPFAFSRSCFFRRREHLHQKALPTPLAAPWQAPGRWLLKIKLLKSMALKRRRRLRKLLLRGIPYYERVLYYEETFSPHSEVRSSAFLSPQFQLQNTKTETNVDLSVAKGREDWAVGEAWPVGSGRWV